MLLGVFTEQLQLVYHLLALTKSGCVTTAVSEELP